MKKIILILTILISTVQLTKAQLNITNSEYFIYPDTPIQDKGVFTWAISGEDSSFVPPAFFSRSIKLGGFDSTNVWFRGIDSLNISSTGNTLLGVTKRGDIYRYDLSDLITILPFKPSSYTVNSNVYSNGFGITKIGTEPAVTFSINQSDIMTVNRAADSIASLDVKINGKVPNSRTITINGTSQDLSANRTWSNVGIELPSQTGNSGKVLSTTGTVTTWINSNSGIVTSVGLTSTDFTVSGSPVTTSGNITANLTTTGVATGTYDWVTVDTKGRVTAAGNTPLPTAIASGARNFNQAYQLSSTRPSFISISAQLSCNLSLTGGQAGNVQLQLSANGSSGWVTYGTITASNTGTLTVGLNTTQVSGGQLTVPIPTGYYWRALTTNTTGTPTYTFNGGYEIIY